MDNPANVDLPWPDEDRDLALAELYSAIDSGEDIEAVIARHPGHEAELRACAAQYKNRLSDPDRTLELVASPLDDFHPCAAGDEVNGLVILRLLGQGGMGVVYLAHDPVHNRKVAIKFRRPEIEPERFKVEREALALLEHVHVIKIFSSGKFREHEYYVMQYVSGGSLAQRLKTLREHPRDAVKILAQISMALAHAHQRGVMHRDLKPANVLFDDSDVPYLADFSTAKFFREDRDLTQPGGPPIGTLYYLAPEQIRREPGSVFVDVHAFGAVMYEVITGRRAFDGPSEFDVEQAILHRQPYFPRTWKIDRDLRTICEKCLQKEASFRYQWATEITDELNRWLDDMPIETRRSSWIERGVKLCRRHPKQTKLVSAVAFMFLVVVTWGATTTWKNRTAERDRLAAELAARQAKQETAHTLEGAEITSQFWLESFVGQGSPDIRPAIRQMTVPELMAEAVKQLETTNRFAGHPEVDAEIRGKLGEVYFDRAEYEKAEPLNRRSYELFRSVFGPDDAHTLIAQNNFGNTLKELQKWGEADRQLRDCVERRIRVLGPTDSLTLTTQGVLANLMWERSDERKDPAGAIALLRACLATHRLAQGEHHPDTLDTTLQLARMLIEQDRYSEGQQLLVPNIEAMRQVWGDRNPSTIYAINLWIDILRENQQFAKAAEVAERNLQAAVDVFGAENSTTVVLRLNYATILKNVDRIDDAIREIEAVITYYRNRGQESEKRDLALALNHLASMLMAQKRFAEAEPVIREAVQIRENLATGVWTTADSQGRLGECLMELGQLEQAKPLVTESYQRLAADRTVVKSQRRAAISRMLRYYELTKQLDQAAICRKQLDDLAADANRP